MKKAKNTITRRVKRSMLTAIERISRMIYRVRYWCLEDTT